MDGPRKISLGEWKQRYERLCASGVIDAGEVRRLGYYFEDGDRRLGKLEFDNSVEALRLWNMLLSEEERLARHRDEGKIIVGAMKDLGTVPVLAYAFDEMVAFYPDGAWWTPCVMQMSAGLLKIADSLGMDESFCPVRAMLGAFVNGKHFPRPDVLTCSAGAVCDDFSVIAQRLEGLGFAIHWWEVPYRREVEKREDAMSLPGGVRAAREQVDFVRGQLEGVLGMLEGAAGRKLDEEELAKSIREANRVRGLLRELRRVVFGAEVCPLGAVEMLVAEMLAIHYCSDRNMCVRVLEGLLELVRKRAARGAGVLDASAVKVFWVNPPADLRVMNLLEDCGARLCGTDYLFTHAIDAISEDVEPMEALARAAMADPMVGSSGQRAERIARDAEEFGAGAVIVSRVPGASHCAMEGTIIRDELKRRTSLKVLEIEVPSVIDADHESLRTRIEALVETVGSVKQI
ncbi:benzoyl-CoA reductase, bzd-type, O subunit [Anaerohalosphaera lusitana]|uniref:Benzoyl-CoA reductase, bzd-type, O subunit n=1 Tax=Anaerohalosphaera lusitana TaxID=1936003 RepID=A0A1U9NJU6_9BACT|nr:2-hydroxyacyl-CoA dehydratase family protein [Anaerohalosphaera lusitana]AQT68213.1 benzoyl-CoA reductase, bzd-type, O subunit [Anaerohalosphaera lusitana]